MSCFSLSLFCLTLTGPSRSIRGIHEVRRSCYAKKGNIFIGKRVFVWGIGGYAALIYDTRHRREFT